MMMVIFCAHSNSTPHHERAPVPVSVAPNIARAHNKCARRRNARAEEMGSTSRFQFPSLPILRARRRNARAQNKCARRRNARAQNKCARRINARAHVFLRARKILRARRINARALNKCAGRINARAEQMRAQQECARAEEMRAQKKCARQKTCSRTAPEMCPRVMLWTECFHGSESPPGRSFPRVMFLRVRFGRLFLRVLNLTRRNLRAFSWFYT